MQLQNAFQEVKAELFTSEFILRNGSTDCTFITTSSAALGEISCICEQVGMSGSGNVMLGLSVENFLALKTVIKSVRRHNVHIVLELVREHYLREDRKETLFERKKSSFFRRKPATFVPTLPTFFGKNRGDTS